MEKVQISEELFIELLQFFLADQTEHLPDIRKKLSAKLDAMVRRELYTTYKTAGTEEEREAARKQYLEQCGMPESFRW